MRQCWIGLTALCSVAAHAATLSLDIARPSAGHAAFTQEAQIDLAGSVTADGAAAVTVRLQDGSAYTAQLVPASSGPAAAGVARHHWTLPGVPLAPGLNVLRIRALAAGRARTAYLSVWRAAEAPGARETDRVADQTGAKSAATSGATSIPEPAAGAGTDGLGIVYPAALWPKVGGVAQVPYVISQGNANVAPAIAQFNSLFAGVIQWVPHGSEADYVDIALDPNNHNGSGESQYVGRHGGAQQIGGSIDIDLGTMLHEMGHVVGLFHEHARADRDAYVSVLSANIIKTLQPGNFDIAAEGAQVTGLYDHASVMHYRPYTFSKNGEPTLESIPPGIPLSALGTYSAGDIDGVQRLYQKTPSAVTVTSNPPGLQVVVDGATVTTPQTFNFALNSVHTLGVPAGAQTLAGSAYTYGRWNDNRAPSHPITIAPGNGLTGSPTNKPAVTVYQANFVELVPFAPTVYPAGSGSLTATPAAQSFPPLAGVYYPARQPVALQAKPAKGYSFYSLYTADGPDGLAGKTTRYPDSVGNVLFTPQATVTIGSNPADRWVWVDGGFWYAPVIFSPYYDSGWGAGSVHTLDVSVSPQYPYSYSIRYPWASWSDGGAQSHAVTLPAGKATYTATFGQAFYAADWAQQGCAGSVAVSPGSADGFYAANSQVTFTQTPNTGWTFTGWLQDATGKANPKTLAMTDERLVIANYNTAAAALAVTSLSPATAVAGQAGFTLTIKGTGFTSASRVFIAGSYRAPTSVSPTQIKLPITAADLAVAGALQVNVENTPPGSWPCAAYSALSLYVRSARAQPLATPAPTALTFVAQPVGTQSAPQTVTLSNGGNAALAYDDLAITGADAGDFSASTTCASGLAAGMQCSIDVTFRPTVAGARTARLMLIDSALNSPQTVTLGGTGSP